MIKLFLVVDRKFSIKQDNVKKGQKYEFQILVTGS